MNTRKGWSRGLTYATSCSSYFVHLRFHRRERCPYGLVAIKDLQQTTRRLERTSNPRLRSDIFLEYSLSATRTSFSICSVLTWTSFRRVMRRSTAASNVLINGFGLNAT